MAGWIRQDEGGITLALRVQPRASRDEVAGLHGDRLKVRITAPPVDGAANEHLRRFIAGLFGVAPAQVRLLRGETGRDKLVAVSGAKSLPPVLAGLAGAPAQGDKAAR
ncbi:MAG: protein Mettu [Proteobacteria bacterium]|nr:protein Mettu [Pseudomonadota bacterium]